MFNNNLFKNKVFKSKKNHLTFASIFMLLSTALFMPRLGWALSSDRNQPININADNQTLDMKNNKVTFSGNVVLTQGSIRLTAGEVVVTRNSNNELESMIGHGSPARFSQKADDGKIMKGQANQLQYLMKEDKIILTTNAQLQQDDSTIKGDKITYLIDKEVLEAQSGGGGRVQTTIIPAQLEN